MFFFNLCPMKSDVIAILIFFLSLQLYIFPNYPGRVLRSVKLFIFCTFTACIVSGAFSV